MPCPPQTAKMPGMYSWENRPGHVVNDSVNSKHAQTRSLHFFSFGSSCHQSIHIATYLQHTPIYFILFLSSDPRAGTHCLPCIYLPSCPSIPTYQSNPIHLSFYLIYLSESLCICLLYLFTLSCTYPLFAIRTQTYQSKITRKAPHTPTGQMRGSACADHWTFIG